jgi:hypothetical protein
MSLTREQILARKRPAPVRVEIPELGGACFVRAISAKERDAYEASLREKRGGLYEMNLQGARARLVSLCACDEHGNRLFSDEDVQALGEEWAAPIDRIFDVAGKLNRITPGDLEELISKNGLTPTASSSTGSPSTSA